MSLWDGVEIIDHEGKKHNAADVLKDKLVALYFSAGECDFKNYLLYIKFTIFIFAIYLYMIISRLVPSLPRFYSKVEEILRNSQEGRQEL